MAFIPTKLFLLCYSIAPINAARPIPGCNAILTDDIFEKCTNRPGEISTYSTGKMGYNKNRLLKLSESNYTQSGNCAHSRVCRKLFKLVRIYGHSFGAKMLVHFSDTLHRCCGNCSRYYMTRAQLDISNVDEGLVNSSDIILPVIMPSVKSNEMNGFYFIPVIKVPGAYYFTLKETKERVAINLIIAYLKMWPLLVITLIVALISGFVTWLLERRHNSKEFPQQFHVGIYEGFWWSFVSITTVGFGDRVPRSIVGRLFAVLFIMIGIIIISILVSSLTNAIMEVRTPKETPMRGKLIGALKHRLHDSIMIAQHGGTLRAVKFASTIIGVVDLMKLLKKGEIEGFLISKTTYYYFSRIMEEERGDGRYASHKESIRDIKMIRTEKSFRGDKLVVGMMVRHYDDYNFFRRFIEYNWLRLQACYMYNLNYKEVKFESHYYSPYEGLFLPFLYGGFILMAMIVCYGIFSEGHANREMVSQRIRKLTSSRQDEPAQPDSTNSKQDPTDISDIVKLKDVYYLSGRY